MAILLVAFVLVMVLIGGLAAVAVTSGEISSSGGYRVRALTETCARAAADRVAQLLPDTEAVKAASGTMGSLSFHVGHILSKNPKGDVIPVVRLLGKNAKGQDTVDRTALAGMYGEMTTNALPGSSSGTGGYDVYGVTVVCSGNGLSPREVEIIVRYGLPTSL